MSKKLVKEPLITLAESQYKQLVSAFENGPNTRLVFANYSLTKFLKSFLEPWCLFKGFSMDWSMDKLQLTQ
jgi:hypothetical protein